MRGATIPITQGGGKRPSAIRPPHSFLSRQAGVFSNMPYLHSSRFWAWKHVAGARAAASRSTYLGRCPSLRAAAGGSPRRCPISQALPSRAAFPATSACP